MLGGISSALESVVSHLRYLWPMAIERGLREMPVALTDRPMSNRQTPVSSRICKAESRAWSRVAVRRGSSIGVNIHNSYVHFCCGKDKNILFISLNHCNFPSAFRFE